MRPTITIRFDLKWKNTIRTALESTDNKKTSAQLHLSGQQVLPKSGSDPH